MWTMLTVAALLMLIASLIWGRPPKRESAAGSSPPTPQTAKIHRGCALGSGLVPLIADETRRSKLIAPWSWLTGKDVELVAMTVFGDLIVRHRSGKATLIDTAWGKAIDLVEPTQVETLRDHPEVKPRLRLDLLRELESSGKVLPPDHVLDWIESPALGGAETVGNLQVISANVRQLTAGAFHQQARGSA